MDRWFWTVVSRRPEQKTLTLDVARRVPGVYQVVDMIRVEKDREGSQCVPVSNTHSVAQPEQRSPSAAVRLRQPASRDSPGGLRLADGNFRGSRSR
jgi:hypothetical protein